MTMTLIQTDEILLSAIKHVDGEIVGHTAASRPIVVMSSWDFPRFLTTILAFGDDRLMAEFVERATVTRAPAKDEEAQVRFVVPALASQA